MKRCFAVLIAVIITLMSVTVFANEITIESIKMGLSATTMKVGETQKIITTITPANANPELVYESDNPDVVTAAIGTLIAKSDGTANITVRVKDTDVFDTVQVKVVNNEAADDEKENVKMSKITVKNKTICLERYETEKIVYSVSPDNAKSDGISFKSSNTSVAEVDDNGYVYAKRAGNATITLESEDGNATSTVKVYVSDEDDEKDYDSMLRNIYITYDGEILKDKFEVMEKTTKELSIKTSPSSASKRVTWRSSNKSIATVDDNGRVTGVKEGTCTIYATSTENSSKRDSVTIVVTDYVRYPDSISIIPHENTVYETGNAVQFTAKVLPEDTTERNVIWRAFGGASISQNGLLKIIDGGMITVKAYSSNYKTVGEYTITAVYSNNHFTHKGSAYNLPNDRNIEMYFDSEVNTMSALANIFASIDESGNGERINITVKVNGDKITISPTDRWPEGDMYLFINSSLYDKYGNLLGKNLKYKLNIRGNVYDKQD